MPSCSWLKHETHTSRSRSEECVFEAWLVAAPGNFRINAQKPGDDGFSLGHAAFQSFPAGYKTGFVNLNLAADRGLFFAAAGVCS